MGIEWQGLGFGVDFRRCPPISIPPSISGLKSTFDTEIETNDHLAANWAFVRDWSEGSRYETDLPGPTARNFYSAVTAPGDGVLSWLKRHW